RSCSRASTRLTAVASSSVARSATSCSLCWRVLSMWLRPRARSASSAGPSTGARAPGSVSARPTVAERARTGRSSRRLTSSASPHGGGEGDDEDERQPAPLSPGRPQGLGLAGAGPDPPARPADRPEPPDPGRAPAVAGGGAVGDLRERAALLGGVDRRRQPPAVPADDRELPPAGP